MIGFFARHFGAFVLASACNCAAALTGNAGTETHAPVQTPPRAQAKVKPKPQDTITIDRAVCRRLFKHRANPDVAYQPGVDVHGNPVASADWDDVPQLRLPESFTIDVTPELTRWLPNAAPPYDRLTGSRINLGAIAVTGDMLTFNGQPLSSEAEENMAVLCLNAVR